MYSTEHELSTFTMLFEIRKSPAGSHTNALTLYCHLKFVATGEMMDYSLTRLILQGRSPLGCASWT